MRFLAVLFCSVILGGCGGGGNESVVSIPVPVVKAAIPSPVKKAATVTGANEIAIHTYQALYGQAPSNAMLIGFVNQIGTSDGFAWAATMIEPFRAMSDSEFSSLVLKNLGITATSLTTSTIDTSVTGAIAYAAIQGALRDYFAVTGVQSRGTVVIQLSKIVSNLEGADVYGAAAIAFNAKAINDYGNTATYSVPVDISKITYPDSYQTPTTLVSDINTDPCKLELSVVTYPHSWIGEYPLPTIKGAPFPANFYGGMSLKDIMLSDNPTFNPNCTGNLNSEFDRTIDRLVNLNVKYVKIPQWHWIQINQDGSWSVVKAENSFGPLPDANLSYFVNAAHKAGLKVIMMNQIQGVNNPDTGYSYVPESNMENYAKWFGAYKVFMLERGSYFQSIGVDVWELGCGYCLFWNAGTESLADLTYFATQTKSLIPIMRIGFKGSLLIMNNSWLLSEAEVINSVDYINFGIYDVGWGRITAANESSYSVQTASLALLSDQLNSDQISQYDKLAKTLVFDTTIQSRANAFAMPGYLEETGCTSSIGNLNISTTSCLQKETAPDFSVQAIFFEAVFESLRSLNLTSKIIPLPMDYWETNSMISSDVFPSLGATIRNKPAEGVVKAWFAK